MKRAMTWALTLALLALPIVAGEPKKTETKPQTTETAAAAAQPAPEDSPLVAASKRAKRLGRKPTSQVITNETLKQSGSGGHVTTAAQQPEIKLPPASQAARPTPEMVAAKEAEARKRAAEVAAAKKKRSEEMQRQRAANAAEAVEEEYPEDDDPAQAEEAQRVVNEDAKPPRF